MPIKLRYTYDQRATQELPAKIDPANQPVVFNSKSGVMPLVLMRGNIPTLLTRSNDQNIQFLGVSNAELQAGYDATDHENIRTRTAEELRAFAKIQYEKDAENGHHLCNTFNVAAGVSDDRIIEIDISRRKTATLRIEAISDKLRRTDPAIVLAPPPEKALG